MPATISPDAFKAMWLERVPVIVRAHLVELARIRADRHPSQPSNEPEP